MIGAVSALAVSGIVSIATPAGAQPGAAGGCSAGAVTAPAKVHVNGKVIAAGTRIAPTRPAAGACSTSGTSRTSDPGVGVPPLYYYGGRVMAVPAVHNKVVMTPIFWAPAGSGYTFTKAYENLIVRYLKDVAADSGKNNIYATNTEYSGHNGTVHYGIKVGNPINDAHAFPTQECTPDAGAVYADNSGYSACLDDAQVTAETSALINARSLPTDLGHMYLMFTPKHVESCFVSDAQVPPGGYNQCTINPSPSATYCAYHSYATGHRNEIYAEMPFPIYNSPVGYTCGSQAKFRKNQSPNGNLDGDVEISPLSHEMSEAITDPNLDAWGDKVGYENGDECAYTYGPVHGTAGKFYNQTVNGHHYLTQEEFSNADFFATYGHGGCVQAEPRPVLNKVKPGSGSHKGGTDVTLVGNYFTRASRVFFDGTAAKVVKVPNSGHLEVVAPRHAAGAVKVVVETIGGKSSAGKFTYK